MGSVQFSSFDLMRLFGLTRNRVQSWIDEGYLVPSIQVAEGQGTKSIFSVDDVYLAGVFVSLVAAGVERKVAKETISSEDLFPKGFEDAYSRGFRYLTITRTAPEKGAPLGKTHYLLYPKWPDPNDEFQFNGLSLLVVNLTLVKKIVDQG